ncbi:MAG: hypothetical protein FWH23_06525 [Bacteroidales bacterium]|nr:hypothetical protein [Bacteroidales bacterium]
MYKTRIYTINDINNFETEFFKIVNTSIDWSKSPWLSLRQIKSEYFGKMQWGKFVIHNKYKKRIWLRIKGEIKNDKLIIRITPSTGWHRIITGIIVIPFFSIHIMLISWYVGLLIMLFLIANEYYFWSVCCRLKNKFIEHIERMIK